MIDRRIGKIKVRRGTDAQRKTVTFEEGELVYSIDKKRLYIGDNSTAGGILVSNRNYIVNTVGNTMSVPTEAIYGDIIYEKITGNTYIVGKNLDESLKLILIASGSDNCCERLQTQINDLTTRLRSLTGCLKETTDESNYILSEIGDTIISESGDFIIWN